MEGQATAHTLRMPENKHCHLEFCKHLEGHSGVAIRSPWHSINMVSYKAVGGDQWHPLRVKVIILSNEILNYMISFY